MSTVLVVEDSRFLRDVVSEALEGAGHRVRAVGTADAALEAVRSGEFDAITMDVELPGTGGLEAVDAIMRDHPTPILVCSAHTDRGGELALDALERGAIDVLEKPGAHDDRTVEDLAAEVVSRVTELATIDDTALAVAYTAARARSVSETVARTPEPVAGAAGPATVDPGETARGGADGPAVVVGASTGGPAVVERLLRTLPPDSGARVLVVQHMPASFTARFADRLDDATGWAVREVDNADLVGAGEAVLAPGDAHLEVVSDAGGPLAVESVAGPPRHGLRPSIDVTMESAARVVEGPLCGVVLSGMGRDGAAGVEAISRAGGLTVAQSESSCPVFGIPRAAIETGHVDHVAPVDAIPTHLLEAAPAAGDRA